MPTSTRSDRLRVVVDGLGLVRDSAYRGIGTYSRHLIAGLASTADLDVTVLVPRGSDVDMPGVRIKGVVRIAPGRWARAEHDRLLPFDLARTRGDVFLGLGPIPPPWAPYPIVNTLYDVFPLVGPTADPTDRAIWLRTTKRWPKVARTVAISEATANDAIHHLGFPRDKIVVAHCGADTDFRPAETAVAPADPPYVLMVGEYDPRKRHELACAVIGELADRLPHRLKIAGRIAPHFATTMAALVAAAPRPDRVDVLGYLSKADLISTYQCADVVIVTSSNEGFGFPALEAMSCGTPVVAFDNSATAEVIASAGVLVPDADVHAMAAAVESVIRDRDGRAARVDAGLARATDFTWARAVELNAQALRDAARSPRV